MQLTIRLRRQFTEVNPDKGTKTVEKLNEEDYAGMFTEVNPDKGTKTIHKDLFMLNYLSLQKLTPIRGRKLL